MAHVQPDCDLRVVLPARAQDVIVDCAVFDGANMKSVELKAISGKSGKSASFVCALVAPHW